MELDPAEGEEAEDCLEDGLADAHHAGGEGRAHCRAQELRVRQHATTHWKKTRIVPVRYFLDLQRYSMQLASVADPDLLAGSGSGKTFRIRNEFEVNYSEKLIKFDKFVYKIAHLKKNINSFFCKKILP
jgi:hypothetical protein